MALDVVEFPEDIAWLDLSFNEITSISDDILEFPALKMIYLHGNKIRRFADIQKLQQLPNLYSLTLHGNPIENYPNYRWSIHHHHIWFHNLKKKKWNSLFFSHPSDSSLLTNQIVLAADFNFNIQYNWFMIRNTYSMED